MRVTEWPGGQCVTAGVYWSNEASNSKLLLTRLNIEERGDLRLKLTNFQPNIRVLVESHQAQPSH